jgi:phosphatidylinositol alpha-1,6-mannosyltransferase
MPASLDLLLLTHEFPPFPGGVARYCSSLAAAATRMGYRVTVAAPEHSANSAVGSLDPPGIEVIRFPGDVFHFRQLKTLERIIGPLLARQSWDTVHAADWPMIMAAASANSNGAYRTASFHGTDIMVLRHSWRARFARSASRLQQYNRYVFNSQYTSTIFMQAFPELRSAQGIIAPLGVDSFWFDPPAKASIDALKMRIDYEPGDRVVLTVARLDERKGHLQCIAALGRLPASNKSHLKYVCIGMASDHALSERISNSAKSHGVTIYLTGAVPIQEVRAAYSIADVFALTAEPMRKKIEGFGLVLLEAAAAGLPSVVTAVHAIPEVVLDGRTGWICLPQDRDAISHNIAKALTNEAKVMMREACISHAKHCTWDICARQTYARADIEIGAK